MILLTVIKNGIQNKDAPLSFECHSSLWRHWMRPWLGGKSHLHCLETSALANWCQVGLERRMGFFVPQFLDRPFTNAHQYHLNYSEWWDPDQESKRQSTCSCSASIPAESPMAATLSSSVFIFLPCFLLFLFSNGCVLASLLPCRYYPRGREGGLTFTRITIHLIQISQDLSIHFFLRHENKGKNTGKNPTRTNYPIT